MNKFSAHTRSLLLLLWFFALGLTSAAAQEQGAEPTIDSAVVSIQANEDSEVFFDAVSDSSLVAARSVPDSVIQKMRADGDYWYVNQAPERQKPQQANTETSENWFQKQWFARLMWFLVIGSFVVILIWFLASSNIRLFRNSSKAGAEDIGEVTEETIFTLAYEKEIQKAVASQNYRLAVRLWYLYTLKQLAENNLIQYKQEKTDREYVHELYQTPHYKPFFHLTRHFEYAWYGKFELSPEAFALLQKDFLNFKQQLPA